MQSGLVPGGVQFPVDQWTVGVRCFHLSEPKLVSFRQLPLGALLQPLGSSAFSLGLFLFFWVFLSMDIGIPVTCLSLVTNAVSECISIWDLASNSLGHVPGSRIAGHITILF